MAKKPSSAPKKTPRGSTAEARRKRVVAGVLGSKSVTRVAEEEGISRSHASALVNSPQSRVEIGIIIDRYHAQSDALVKCAFDALADGFAAEKQAVVQHSEKDGDKFIRSNEVVNLGPDHFVRLTAVKRLIELLVAGRAVPKHVTPADEPGMSLEDLERWAERYWQEKGK